MSKYKNNKYYQQAIDFTRDYITHTRNGKKNPFKFTVRSWSIFWNEDDLTNITRVAIQMIRYVKQQHPEKLQYKI